MDLETCLNCGEQYAPYNAACPFCHSREWMFPGRLPVPSPINKIVGWPLDFFAVFFLMASFLALRVVFFPHQVNLYS